MTRLDSPISDGRVLRWRSISLIVRPRAILVTSILVFASLALAVAGMATGTMEISYQEVFFAIFGSGDRPAVVHVVQNIRVPRVVTAVFAGAALGLSGALFQSISRNVLGSPDVIGFTTGAATGAIVQIIVFQAPPLQVALGAVIAGLLTAVIVYLLSMRGHVTGGYRLILVGIGVGAILSAVNSLLLVIGDVDTAIMANLWLAGSLDARTWLHALPVMIGFLVMLPLAMALSRRATLVEMGDDMAAQLGVRVERTRLTMMIIGVVLAALATGAAGPIAFVALAAGQLASRLTRTRGVPLVSAAAMGACLLVLADVITQFLPVDMTLPIGRVTGVIGGLYLIYLLTRSKQV